jgi:SAM-dependent methyltransferase
MDTQNKLPEGFENPTALPTSHSTHDQWQEGNRDWWERNPMRYDWNEHIGSMESERQFFIEIDSRHFADAARYTPPHSRPFDELIPYDSLKNADVLEIGIGNGSHAQLLAPHCRTYSGIDLTDYAVASTQRRFQLWNLHGNIRRMDAEQLDFPDASFDFIWTWGVIHHSANTEKILQEMRRVLRPGGKAVVMVYHRSFLYYYIFSGFFRGVLAGGLFKTRSLHRLVQLSTDGAIARFYSIAEWRALAGRYFQVTKIQIKGQKSEIIPLPPGRLKTGLMKLVPDALARLVLSRFKQGSFIISHLEKT